MTNNHMGRMLLLMCAVLLCCSCGRKAEATSDNNKQTSIMLEASETPTITAKSANTKSVSAQWELKDIENAKVIFNCDVITEDNPEQNWLNTQDLDVYLETAESDGYEWRTSSISADIAENKSYILISINGDLSKNNKFIKTFELYATVYKENLTIKSD